MKRIFIIVFFTSLILCCENKDELVYTPFFPDESSKLLLMRQNLREDGDIRSGLKGVFINYPLRTDDKNSKGNPSVGVLIDIVLEKDGIERIRCSIGNELLNPAEVKVSKTIGDLSLCSLGYVINSELFISGEMKLGLDDSKQTIIDALLLDKWKVNVYNQTLDPSELKESVLSAWFLPNELVVRQITPDEWESMQ